MRIQWQVAAVVIALGLAPVAWAQLSDESDEPSALQPAAIQEDRVYSATFVTDADGKPPLPFDSAEHGMVPSHGAMAPTEDAPSPGPLPGAEYGGQMSSGGTCGCTSGGACTCEHCGCGNWGGCESCGGGDCGCDSGCGDSACALECDECPPWRLFGCCHCLKCNRVGIRGWLNGGYTSNFEDPLSRFNGPVTFNDRDEAQFNQAYAILERKIEPGDCCWDIGGRVDLLYGSDYRFTLSRGLDARDDFTSKWHNSRFYGLALPQAYAEIGYSDLSVKVGHFYTILGYEVVPAPDNFFYSHAYTFQYGEPFTNTGFLGTWAPNDHFNLLAGANYGWDNSDNINNNVSFLGGATFTASDGNSKLAFAAQAGEEETIFGLGTPNDQRWVYSVVYSRSITDRLSYVIQHDNGRQDNFNESGETADWYGVNQYMFYKINCCWTAGVRLEWFRDDDGARVAPVGDYPAQGFTNNPASFGGFEGNFYELTMGVNYKPTTNLTFRPELRYDWYDGDQNFLGNDPYDDGSSASQWLAAVDVIWQW